MSKSEIVGNKQSGYGMGIDMWMFKVCHHCGSTTPGEHYCKGVVEEINGVMKNRATLLAKQGITAEVKYLTVTD